MTLGDLLVQMARQRPDAAAIIDEHAGAGRARRLTFAELEAEVSAAAAWLHAQGLRRGDAVLVFVPMSAALYVALLAMFRLGVVALFLDPAAGREHMDRCCARWTPAAFLAVPKAHLLRLRSAALRRIPRKFVLGRCWLPGARCWLGGRNSEAIRPDEVQAAGPDDAALVTFTSGSTGVPKAAVRTHAFLLAQYRALAPSIELVAGEVDLATLPVFTLANLAAGVATLIAPVDLRRPGEVDAGAVFAAARRHRVDRITASPAFFERLIIHARTCGETLPGLRKLHTGGAPVFPRLLEGLRELAPDARAVAVYGSTEAEPIAHLAREELSAEDLAAMRTGKGLLAGHPVASIKVRVLRDRWGEPRPPTDAAGLEGETLPAGEVGEIAVAGAHVISGYLGGIGDAETKWHVEGEVWHRTGDAGHFDEQGRLWLQGRCAARIDDTHGRLYPFGVECTAMSFSEVVRAAVVAHAGRRLLVVEMKRLQPGAEDDLVRQLREATAWAHVAAVHRIVRMPVDGRHNAKIDYVRLRAWVERL